MVTLTGSNFGPRAPWAFRRADEQSFTKINESMAILSGGYRLTKNGGGGRSGFRARDSERHGSNNGNRFLDEAFFYDVAGKRWIPAPSMTQRRAHHYTGALRDSNDGANIILAAGGRNSYNKDHGIMSSAEILVEGSSYWSPSTPIPEAIYDGEMVAGGDGTSLFLMGGKVRDNSWRFWGGWWNSWNSPVRTNVVYRVTVNNRVLNWELVDSLSRPRNGFVAMCVPDSLVSCT